MSPTKKPNKNISNIITELIYLENIFILIYTKNLKLNI